VFDQSKKEQEIRDLKIALNHNKKLEERQNELEKRLNEFAYGENELLQAFKMIKNGYVTLEDVKGGKINLRFTDKAVLKKSDN